MRLNHLDSHVPDVAATRDFLFHLFDLHLTRAARQRRIGHPADDEGLEIVISRPSPKFGTADAVSAGVATFHIGFILPNRKAVDTRYERLVRAGVEIGQPPRAVRGGWLSTVLRPDAS